MQNAAARDNAIRILQLLDMREKVVNANTHLSVLPLLEEPSDTPVQFYNHRSVSDMERELKAFEQQKEILRYVFHVAQKPGEEINTTLSEVEVNILELGETIRRNKNLPDLLEALPREIIRRILCFLTRSQDLVHFCLVSKKAYSLVVDRLSDFSLPLNWEALFKILDAPQCYHHHTMGSQIHNLILNKCPVSRESVGEVVTWRLSFGFISKFQSALFMDTKSITNLVEFFSVVHDSFPLSCARDFKDTLMHPQLFVKMESPVKHLLKSIFDPRVAGASAALKRRRQYDEDIFLLKLPRFLVELLVNCQDTGNSTGLIFLIILIVSSVLGETVRMDNDDEWWITPDFATIFAFAIIHSLRRRAAMETLRTLKILHEKLNIFDRVACLFFQKVTKRVQEMVSILDQIHKLFNDPKGILNEIYSTQSSPISTFYNFLKEFVIQHSSGNLHFFQIMKPALLIKAFIEGKIETSVLSRVLMRNEELGGILGGQTKEEKLESLSTFFISAVTNFYRIPDPLKDFLSQFYPKFPVVRFHLNWDTTELENCSNMEELDE